MSKRWIGLGLVLASAGAAMAPAVAEACGGCFAPPETQQVVTDHRMVMAVHSDESILWDQIRYTGRPEDFSWVLPVFGTVRIELASGGFFDQLDNFTAPRVIPPPRNCGFRNAAFGAPTSASGDSSGADAGVQVLQQAIVGPYSTVVLRSDSADSLTTWLRDNHYTVPPAIEPVIRAYTERHMDFVALRLSPGEGIQAMQPVRIRYASANMVLPLQMVAAGIADKVGISLWIVGTGRYEAANFGNGEINPGAIVWNWDRNGSNYRDVFQSTLLGIANGRAWITEFAQPADRLDGIFSRFVQPQPDRDAGPGSDAASGDGGTPVPEVTPHDDWQLATHDNAPGLWLTRMRTDLGARFLDADLQLQASLDTSEVSGTFNPTRTIGTDPCGNSSNGAIAGGGGGCSIGPSSARTAMHFGPGLLAGGLAFFSAYRRRNRRKN